MVASEFKQAKAVLEVSQNLKQSSKKPNRNRKYRGSIFQLVSVKSVSLKSHTLQSTSPSSSLLHAIPHVNTATRYLNPVNIKYSLILHLGREPKALVNIPIGTR